MNIRAKLLITICTGLVLAISSIAIAQDEAPNQTLFTNVNVFDGFADELASNTDWLI